MANFSNRPRYQSGVPGWREFITAFLIAAASVCFAADKSGVSPTSISLPAGPGSIEGLGSEYEPNLNTGTAGYNLPILLPAGTAGNKPSLSLVYEGGFGNSSMGFGWALSLSSIRRQCDKGIPHYDPNGQDDDFDDLIDEPDEQDRFLDPSGQELVLMDNGIYYPETQEQFIRWRHITNDGNDYWEGHQPNGSVLLYGLTSNARISGEKGIFKWFLEKQRDPNGNEVEFHYTEFEGSEGQKYLQEIRYGPGASPWEVFYLVALSYEDRPDVLDDYRSGFLIRTGKRLAQIHVALQGMTPAGHLPGDVNGDGMTDALIRRYQLDYEADPYWSLLSKVTLCGADGILSLPPAVFGYPNQEPPRSVSAIDAVITSQNTPLKVMDNDFVELVDLNADGLPDILQTDLSARHTAYLNEGIREDGEDPYIQWGAMQYVQAEDSGGEALQRYLADSQVSLSDMDGDGLADLVFHPSLTGMPIYYRNKGSMEWGSRDLMAIGDSLPPAPFAHADVRTFDVDFDKRMDIVKSISTGYQVWYNLGAGEDGNVRYSSRVLTPGAVHDNTVIVFGDEFGTPISGIQLADLNGDRIIDVARIRPSQVIFCAAKGYGKYAESIEILIPPDDGFGLEQGFSYLTSEQIERASLSDITGDGLADLVVERAGFRQLWYWINRGNGTFDTRRFITELPSNFTTLVPSVRWADMNGNGTTDLVYADSGLSDELRVRVVDLGLLINGSAETNLLTSIENGIGMKTLIEYRPSTAFSVEDRLAGTPWAYALPNPVNVISRVTVDDGLGHDSVSEFRYHDGYYHGVEKEFRGFARAERVDIGDESQPTLVTEYHFDVGQTEEALKGKALRMIAKTETGEVFSDEENIWDTRQLFTISPAPLDPLEPDDIVFPYLSETIQTLREEPSGATQAVILQSSYAYDDYGNQVMEAEYGQVKDEDLNFGNDERINWIVYSATPDSLVWNVPVVKIVSDNSNPPRLSSYQQSFYDGQPFLGLPLGDVTLGKLMRVRQWAGPSNPATPPDPLPEPEPRFLAVTENSDHTISLLVTDSTGTPKDLEEDHWIETERYRYDSYGNVNCSADPLAQIEESSPKFNEGHLREFGYDSTLHTYPEYEKIYTGGIEPLEFSVAYDLAFGAITSSSDYNENQSRYYYDSLARLTSIVQPGGNPPDSEEMPTVLYQYVLASPVSITSGTGVINWIETRRHEQFGAEEEYLISRTYQDGLGRVILTKNEDEDPARAVVQQAVTFNKRRQPFRTLLPFYSLNGLEFEDIYSPGWTGVWTIDGQEETLELSEAPSIGDYYDATGRPIRRVNSDQTFAQTEYYPLRKIETDEEDTNSNSNHYATPEVYSEDGLGRLVSVDERVRLSDEGLSTENIACWHTCYEYDLRDNLVKITDSQSNRKIMRYDALGRMVYMDDPNRGRIWRTYDDASNAIESVDAKGQRTTCTFDGVNRLLTEDYHDEEESYSPGYRYDPSEPISPVNRPDAVFFYDAPASFFPNGLLNSSLPASNARGQMTCVVDLAGEEYHSYDERQNLIWTIKRIPDPRNGVPVSYKTETEYDAHNRMSKIVYPDGDEVEYLYNHRGLLEQIKGDGSVHPDGSPLIMKNADYTPSGLTQYCSYGDGVTTRKRYDKRNRLTAIRTAQDDSPENPIIAYDYQMDGVSNIVRIDDRRSGQICPQGSRKRNTQIFNYDNLYRITQVKYSFALPGQSDRNDGQIDYRYDRIGNMLFKSSPEGSGHIDHDENGYSVVNLGTMTIGGNLGAWNRTGRSPDDPPGNHAVTASNQGGEYSYDANGNMTRINELICTYNFRDDLVSVKNDEMQAEYLYDYAGRRVIKNVWHVNNDGIFDSSPSETILYIGKLFEIREHEETVKHVWDGGTRIARVIGTLNESVERIQRIRIFPGWNLLTLAVESSTAVAQIADQIHPSTFEAYIPDVTPGQYIPLEAGDSLHAGQPFWLQAYSEFVLEIQGNYTEPAEIEMASGVHAMGWAGLETFSLGEILPKEIEQAWFYDSEMGKWRGRASGSREFIAVDPLDYLSPGQVLFVQLSEETALDLPSYSYRILYYHQDHLRSTNLLCDAEGSLIEESVYYPFGQIRHTERMKQTPERAIGNYGFSQKERDPESGLQYFENRYLAGPLCRFISVDPAVFGYPQEALLDPQKLDPYGYARKNPLVYVDTDGQLEELLELMVALPGAAIRGAIVEAAKTPLSSSRYKKMGGNKDAKSFYLKSRTEASVYINIAESFLEKTAEWGFKSALKSAGASEGVQEVFGSALGEALSGAISGMMEEFVKKKIDTATERKFQVNLGKERGAKEFFKAGGVGALTGSLSGMASAGAKAGIQELMGEGFESSLVSALAGAGMDLTFKELIPAAFKKYQSKKQAAQQGRAGAKPALERQGHIPAAED